MTANLTNPIFQNEEKAIEHFEAIRWPTGPVCPHCGVTNEATRVQGKSHRAGMWQCNACREPFTVKVGTVMESSHIPMHKWALAFHLMAASKKGVSAHQLHRMLGVTYKSAWFMAHRVREAMSTPNASPIGGEGKSIEVDETYIGTKAGSRKGIPGGSGKRAVVTLVERGGRARSFHVSDVSALTVPELLRKYADAKSTLYTDEARVYSDPGKRFAAHEAVKHSIEEWVRGDAHTNTVEGFFSVFKRGMRGVYQHCGEQHLHRYLSEFDFRYSNRVATGVDDVMRTMRAIKGAEGKRLTYKQPRSEKQA